MLRSNWLILEDRNQFTSNLMIGEYSVNTPEQAHRVYHNAPGEF